MIEFTTTVTFLVAGIFSTTTPLIATTTPLVTPAISATTTPISTTTPTPVPAPVVDMTDKKTVENYLREQYADTPILVEIARCESTFSQFDKNGKLVRGRINKSDVGVMQINEEYHALKAIELGYNLHTIEGNVDYAKYLYEKEGAKPWKSSQKCWSKKNIS